MFLKTLIKRNPKFLETVVELHQAGKIPANSYVLDIDTLRNNARTLVTEAKKLNLKIFAMTKQIGRNPVALKAMAEAGLDACVAVDVACARPVHASGLKVGHIGHLVQVPRAEAQTVAKMNPLYWTVFSDEKAQEAADASSKVNRRQDLLARIFAPGDKFYTGHEGGFEAEHILEVADRLDGLSGARFAGITTFPALLFDNTSDKIIPTPNLTTLEKTAHKLGAAGRNNIEVNAPGTTSSVVMPALASAGATQIEPGHGLTGTTPLHAIRELPELPAVLYLSEISHIHNGHPYCFGGGLYIDPVFPAYDVQALVGPDPETALKNPISVSIPAPEAIDYYGILNPPAQARIRTGDSVVFGFRIQAFVTRAFMAPVSGISTGNPHVEGIWSVDGKKTDWP